jgi:hypothetical protein
MNTMADQNMIEISHGGDLDMQRVFEYIQSHTGRIEITMNGNLQRVYFPKPPVCLYISPQAKKDLMINVVRESNTTKIADLIDAVPDLMDEMELNEKLNNAMIKITPQLMNKLKDFSSIVGLVMNCLFLFFAKRKYHYREPDIDEWVIDAIEILGWVQGSSSLVLIFFFIVNRKELICKKGWRDFINDNVLAGKYEPLPNEEQLSAQQMSYEQTHLILMLRGPGATEFNMARDEEAGKGGGRDFGNFFTTLEYKLLTFTFFIQSSTFQYYVLYFAISMLGKQSSSIYYSFHLLDVINRSPILLNVMKAITQNIYQTSLTGLLMMIFVYIYASMTFFYLQDGMYDYGINAYDSDIVGENNCQSMFQCYVTMIDKGTRFGGGVGDITLPTHYLNDVEKYGFKLFKDATFQIVINIICLNIIFGIIVNSFASLRDERSKNEEDMHNVCYICDLGRLTFDSRTSAQHGFQGHIKKDHYLWAYVFYIVYLNSKDASDYTGVESYVTDRLAVCDQGWIPRQRALCLNESSDNLDDEDPLTLMQNNMAKWNSEIERCLQTLGEVESKIEKNEKMKQEHLQDLEKQKTKNNLRQNKA